MTQPNLNQTPPTLADIAHAGADFLDEVWQGDANSSVDRVDDFSDDELQALADRVYDLLRHKIQQERARSGVW